MPFPIELDQASYETLVEFARQGTLDAAGNVVQSKALGLESWLRNLERNSGISRYFLWVQWQEQNASLAPSVRFPERWPPELRGSITLTTRPITRSDVDALLAARAREPTNVLVTRDPAAVVGWTQLAEYFK